MNGICDVKGCGRETYMGWRPLTERSGRQICEHHWLRHKDEKNRFDLYEEFKFKRPARIHRRRVKTEKRWCVCGRALQPKHKFCSACTDERERRRKKLAYHKRKRPDPDTKANILKCRACGRQRKPGYTYCSECAKHRKTMTRRQAQSRYWKKRHKVAV